MKSVSGMIFGILGVVLLIVAGLAGQGTSINAQEGNDDVRVMTYNIKHGQGNDDCEDEGTPEGMPQGTPEGFPQGTPEGTPSAAQCAVDLDRTTDVIASFEPDIVALQEVDRSWARSGGVDQPTELVQTLDMNACFGTNLNHEPDEHADEPHQYGTLTLSTYPILSCDNTLLPTSEGWEQRGLLEVRVEIDGLGEVAILNTHLQAGREGDEEEAVRLRTEQAETIAERIADLNVPVILMGDFNAEPDDEELTSLRDPERGLQDEKFVSPQAEKLMALLDPELGLQDAWQVAGDEESEGYTSPASPDEDAERRIDSIFVSSEFEVLSAEVPVTEDTLITSDHLPVVADLAPARPPEATPIISTDITPEPTPIDETPPVEEPTVIIAPIREPVEEATPIRDGEVEPTEIPPTDEATEEPEAQPTAEPTQEPTAEPTVEPTAVPTQEPTAEPTVEPTVEPAGESPVDPPAQAPVVPAEESTAEPTGESPAAPVDGPPAEEPPGPPIETPPAND